MSFEDEPEDELTPIEQRVLLNNTLMMALKTLVHELDRAYTGEDQYISIGGSHALLSDEKKIHKISEGLNRLKESLAIQYELTQEAESPPYDGDDGRETVAMRNLEMKVRGK